MRSMGWVRVERAGLPDENIDAKDGRREYGCSVGKYQQMSITSPKFSPLFSFSSFPYPTFSFSFLPSLSLPLCLSLCLCLSLFVFLSL